MGKSIPRGYAKIRNGLACAPVQFANVAGANAAGYTAANYPGVIINLTAGGAGNANCLAFSDGTNWKIVATLTTTAN